MLHVLSFLLSWFSGMLTVLTIAFFSYDEFSMIDIVSFAMLTIAGFLILFLLIYIFVLKTINKRVTSSKQFFYFPVIFSLLANLPAYILIWKYSGDLYGSSEAALFTLGFLTSGLVFGLFWAWKNKVLNQLERV